MHSLLPHTQEFLKVVLSATYIDERLTISSETSDPNHDFLNKLLRSDALLTVHSFHGLVCEEDPDATTNNIVWESGRAGVLLQVDEADCQVDHYSNKTLTDNTTEVRCTGNGWFIVHPCVRGMEGTPIGKLIIHRIQVDHLSSQVQ